MTNLPPTQEFALNQSPDQNSADARDLRERLRSAFESQQEQEKRRDDKFDRIHDGLQNGQFGGLPQTGPYALALLDLLHDLDWQPSIEQFARAMPHFPDRFEMVQMRDVLARLGYSSERMQIKLSRVNAQSLPAIVESKGEVSVLFQDGDGKIKLRDPVSGDTRKGKRGRLYTLVTFAATTQEQIKARSPKNWLAHHLRRFRFEIGELLAFTFVINLMVLATSFAVMSIYDKVIPQGAFDTLTAIVIALVLASGFELMFRRIKSKLIGHTTGRLEYLLGTSIFSKLLKLPVAMITNTPVGDQISRLRQFEAVRDLFSGPFVAVGLEIPFVIMFMVGLFIVAGPLGFVPLALMIVYGVIGLLLVGPIRRQNEESGKKQRAHYEMTLETASNLRQIRSFGCEDVWLERLAEKTAVSAHARRKAGLAQRFLSTLSTAAVPIAGASTVVIGAVLVMQQQMSVGMLIGAMIVIWRVLAPIQQMFLMFTRYTEIGQMIGQIDQLMRLPEMESASETPMKRRFEGEVSFDRVSFRYQGAADSSLMGMSFDIKPGELIAIHGHSGAGKTTVLRMILDLYRPQSGAVLVDGINVRQIAPTELRAAVGYVPQKPALFHGTIAQNLRLSCPAATDEDLRKVCEEVGILASIDQLEKGMNTLLDHARQGTMPGGFSQAISIAQALLRNPKVLLLDEPASTLDFDLERALIKCLNNRRGRTTIIMVSHRPSHVRMADRVLKISRGVLESFDPPQQPKQAG